MIEFYAGPWLVSLMWHPYEWGYWNFHYEKDQEYTKIAAGPIILRRLKEKENFL